MRVPRSFAVLAVLPLVLVGCSGGRGPAEFATGGTFTLALSNDPGNLDPLMTVLSVTRDVSHLAYDTLVTVAPDGKFASGLAERWEADPRRATFVLKPNIACSDGSLLTATDVAANITFVSDPASQSPLLGVVLSPGAQATADDAGRTVTVTTEKPNAFLLNELANLFIVCRAGTVDRTKLAKATLGTGPWVLTEAVADDHYTYEKRQGYEWGPDGARLDQPGVPDRVVARVLANQTTTANLVLSGEVNMATIRGPDRARLDQQGLSKIELRYPLGQTVFNQDANRPGADPVVREALITGTDMATVGRVATADAAIPSRGLVTQDPKPCAGDTVAGALPGHDPAAAKAMLSAAGWVPGTDGKRAKDGKPLSLSFIYPAASGGSGAAGAELLARQWQELGAAVQLRAVTSTELNEVLFSTSDWDAGWVPITVNLPSQLVGVYSGALPPEGTNFAHLNNTAYQTAVAEAATLDREPACQRWNAAERALMESFDLIPMFDQHVPIFFQRATAQLSGGELSGTSLRLLKQ